MEKFQELRELIGSWKFSDYLEEVTDAKSVPISDRARFLEDQEQDHQALILAELENFRKAAPASADGRMIQATFKGIHHTAQERVVRWTRDQFGKQITPRMARTCFKEFQEDNAS